MEIHRYIIVYADMVELADTPGSGPGGSDTVQVQVLLSVPAGMAELADALDSGSNGRKTVQVQVLLPAP